MIAPYLGVVLTPGLAFQILFVIRHCALAIILAERKAAQNQRPVDRALLAERGATAGALEESERRRRQEVPLNKVQSWRSLRHFKMRPN